VERAASLARREGADVCDRSRYETFIGVAQTSEDTAVAAFKGSCPVWRSTGRRSRRHLRFILSQAVHATAERDGAEVLHASLVCATIAKGRIADIDASAALRINGVVSILTHHNLPHIAEEQFDKDATMPAASPLWLLHHNEIVFIGQPVALVAERPEIARLAASRVRVEYKEQVPSDVDLHDDVSIEDHDPMERDVATAVFEGSGRLSIRGTTDGVHQDLGGRFGSGRGAQVQVMLAARAALALQCAVRLVLTRQQMHDLATGPRSFAELKAFGRVQSAPVHRGRFVAVMSMSATCAA
jgi:CO/xanthine dehydrogenase Mo-binding subunit